MWILKKFSGLTFFFAPQDNIEVVAGNSLFFSFSGLVSNSDKPDFLGNQEADGQSEKATLLQISRTK